MGSYRLKFEAYTLWVKFRKDKWRPALTIKTEEDGLWYSPIEMIEDFMDRFGGYWQRGETWMIKPEGEIPAELRDQNERRQRQGSVRKI